MTVFHVFKIVQIVLNKAYRYIWKYYLGNISFQNHKISFSCSAIKFSLQEKKTKDKKIQVSKTKVLKCKLEHFQDMLQTTTSSPGYIVILAFYSNKNGILSGNMPLRQGWLIM